MPTEEAAVLKCFVIMGFGEKTDPGTGRLLNLDATYHNVIKPAAQAAGYACVRADEVLHSGVIDIPMYEMLLDADLVVADVSTSNLNAMFELGVRYALKPRSTIVIAESKFSSPFDINHIVIRKYTHLGPDIGYSEVGRMQQQLTLLMKAIQRSNAPDSPVYSLLSSLKPPTQKIKQASSSYAKSLVTAQDETYAAQWQEAMTARAAGDFVKEKATLIGIYESQAAKSGEDENAVRPRVIRELAFATYKIGDKELETNSSAAAAAYEEAISLLQILEPDQTTDPETLGLWSGVHKRRSALPGRAADDRLADLDTAIYAAERGFLIRQDYYTGINLAYLFDVRASISSGEYKIADRVFANRVRRRVVDAAEKALNSLPEQFEQTEDRGTKIMTLYWPQATLAEALIGLNDPRGETELAKAKQMAPADWMVEITLQQIEDLKRMRKA
ncbi:tetratricopeptide repeat-containing protein [Rhizobium leguminosarum]|uniref:tetratricopeptide repeat-containing protein n=1 Tax=Rhizobium leguminosarum TaxID=384 RepID=UPI003F999357